MDIKEIKGIGDKTATLFSKVGINTVEDLISYYPRDYELFKSPQLISDITYAQVGQNVAVDCVIYNKPDLKRFGKKSIVSCIAKDIDGRGIKCIWFNMPYIINTVKKGMRFVFRGRLVHSGENFTLEQPKVYSLADYESLAGKLKPVYGLTKGLSNNAVVKAVNGAFDKTGNNFQDDYLDENVRDRFGLIYTFESVYSMHFPKDMEELNEARKRVIFDEFFMFMLAVRRQKLLNEEINNSYIIEKSEKTDDIIKSLQYELTDSQKSAVESIRHDLSSPGPMNRLLHGDVGSGKTIVAFIALLDTVFAGYQGALMAPTEVLAVQEYNELQKLIEKNNLSIKVALLTSAIDSSEKKRIYEEMESGEIDIVIGTHAVIQGRVRFNNLALAITDEQHRFGVNQRKNLRNKGSDENISCNVLVMSATPIPRTLAWIIYGDLDISVMDVMPYGRLPIKNAVIDSGYMPNVYSFMEKHIRAGQQAYIICPMIEKNEDIDAADVYTVAEDFKEHLPKDIKTGILHGKMSTSEKIDIMEHFAKGETNILVSTTVIEVGVNVPNATIMLIYNADRFGLSTLHQLRGRVGRGNLQSYCMFLSDSKGENAKNRLKVISSTNDGFKIAEDDLKLRGPGDFFGVRQSGEILFAMADPERDTEIFENAKSYVDEIVGEDPELESSKYVKIREHLKEYLRNRDDELNL